MAILDGPLPTPRAHHSMNFIGHLAFIFGGRVEQDLVPDSDPSLFCYLDLQQRKWVSMVCMMGSSAGCTTAMNCR